MLPGFATRSVSASGGAPVEGASVMRTDAGVPQIGAAPADVVACVSGWEEADTLPRAESDPRAAGRRPPTTNEAMSATWIIFYRGPVMRETGAA